VILFQSIWGVETINTISVTKIRNAVSRRIAMVKSRYFHCERLFLDCFSSLFCGHYSTYGRTKRETYSSLEVLVDNHFALTDQSNHICRSTLYDALSGLSGKPASILETGSSAWGANSSMLFDSYVNSFSGNLSSVDIRLEPSITLARRCSVHSEFFCDESINFLKRMAKSGEQYNLVDLDSWDVDWLEPLPAAIHGFHEFLTVLPVLVSSRGLLLVDDTPLDSNVFASVTGLPPNVFDEFSDKYGFLPGKGGMIVEYLTRHNIGKKLSHHYQVLYSFD
jgi:hypothetical protein